MFNGQLLHPDKPMGRPHKNLYGSKTPSHINSKGLREHMDEQNYTPIEADRFVYLKPEKRVL